MLGLPYIYILGLLYIYANFFWKEIWKSYAKLKNE
jgi:hypothetical protein